MVHMKLIMALVAFLAACGVDSDKTDPPPAEQCTFRAEEIVGNHTPPHEMAFLRADDVLPGEEPTYRFVLSPAGSDGHTHEVRFTATDFGLVQIGQAATETTTANSGHTHDVTIVCD